MSQHDLGFCYALMKKFYLDIRESTVPQKLLGKEFKGWCTHATMRNPTETRNFENFIF